jgi:hypothetical protein
MITRVRYGTITNYAILKSLNYEVWMYERELKAGSSPLTAELTLAIKLLQLIFEF